MLSGCRLAKEDFGTNKYDDKLIGILITTKSLDQFELGNYLNENPQKYQNRILANLISKTMISEVTEQSYEAEEYIFDSIEGIAFYSPTIPAKDGGGRHINTTEDEIISDISKALNYSDNDSSMALTGTIYITQSSKHDKLYVNPVFQSPDGSVYTTSGSTAFLVQAGYGEGHFMSLSYSATTATTNNRTTTTHDASITIRLNLLFTPERITIVQMDADSQLIARTDYFPGTLPQEFTPASNTDYIIVETHKFDRLGNSVITRDIYDRVPTQNDTLIATFSARDDGFCIKNYSQLKWQ